MKRSLFLFVILVFVCAHASAQQPVKSAVEPSSEQSLQELVTEVRQLRAALQRMNAAVYKGQVLLERLKFQQEQVTRISRELVQVREDVQEVRLTRPRIKETVRRMEETVESGVRHGNELAPMKLELEALVQREHRLAMRETRLAADLEGATAILNDLNNKLNALVELEMTPK